MPLNHQGLTGLGTRWSVGLGSETFYIILLHNIARMWNICVDLRMLYQA